jgi:hypothetical protein
VTPSPTSALATSETAGGHSPVRPV